MPDLDSQEPSESVNARWWLPMLRRRAWIVAVCLVLVPGAALAASLASTKQYTATTQLLFRDPGFDQKLFGSSFLSPSEDPVRRAATNVRLVSLENVYARASRDLGGRPTASELRSKVQVLSQGQSDVVALEVTDQSPERAAQIANVVAEQYIAFRRQADQTTILRTLDLIDKQLGSLPRRERIGSRGRSLRSRSEQLQILASLQTGNAELVQRAQVPGGPSSPRIMRNVVNGIILGVLLGLLLAVLAERLDRRLRDPSEIEAIMGGPILAEVPEIADLERSKLLVNGRGREIEPFRTLRMNLRFLNVGRGAHSVVVTSAVPGEGKSTIALNLALTAAASGTRVILVEGDLRRPTLSNTVGLPPHSGLVSAVVDEVDLDDCIQAYRFEYGGRDREMAILTAGAVPPNPSELLESARMEHILEELKNEYELIVIDSPPLTVVSDAVPFAERTSGMVVVVRAGKSTRHAVRALRRRLDNLGMKPLGVVFNAVSLRHHLTYYDYYEYDSDRTEQQKVRAGAGDDRSGNGSLQPPPASRPRPAGDREDGVNLVGKSWRRSRAPDDSGP